MTDTAEQGPITLPDEPLDLSAFADEPKSSGPKTQVPPRRERIRDRVRQPSKKAEPKKKEPASKPGEFVEPLSEIYVMLGMGVGFVDHDGICGPVIATNAQSMATAWDELAQKNESVRRTLRKLTQGGAWAGVLAAHAPVALAIMSAHNMLPEMPSLMPEPEPEPEPESKVKPEPVKRTRAKKRTQPKPKPEDRTAANERRSTATNG